jgi:phosphatidylinositol glycan class O
MDNNTILMVFGDHGMSLEGGHGGGSEFEISSTLFAITKNE